MKTAVSISDEIFESGESAAKRLGITRSELYARALSRYLAELGDDPVTEALNRLADDDAVEDLPNVGRDLIERGDWQW